MNIMTSKINYIFNQGFENTFVPGYGDNSGAVTSQSTTKEGGNINFINDNNLDNRSSTEKGLAEYFDLSFTNLIDVSELQGVVIYSSPEIKNYNIQKIRYETTGNVKLDVSEIQLWVNNENIVIQDKTSPSYSFILNGPCRYCYGLFVVVQSTSCLVELTPIQRVENLRPDGDVHTDAVYWSNR